MCHFCVYNSFITCACIHGATLCGNTSDSYSLFVSRYAAACSLVRCGCRMCTTRSGAAECLTCRRCRQRLSRNENIKLATIYLRANELVLMLIRALWCELQLSHKCRVLYTQVDKKACCPFVRSAAHGDLAINKQQCAF